MSRAPTIDVHAHMLPEETIRRLAAESPRVAPCLIEENGQLIMEIAGKVVQRPMPRAIFDLDLRLRDMDQHGVAVQLVCATIQTFFYDEEPALGAACAALQNDLLANVVRRNPDRLLGLATLPMQDPARAADELTRAMTTLGLKGAQIGSNINGRNLDDPALEPVWAVANRLNAFFLIHPNGEIMPGDRLKSYYMRNFVGLPFETTIAGAALTFGGVLERFPGIAFCLCHGGGFLPYQRGRFLHAWQVRPEPKARLRGRPEASWHNLYFDSIVHATRALDFLIDTVGADHVLLGSDYPFDMGNLDCVARVGALTRPQRGARRGAGSQRGQVAEVGLGLEDRQTAQRTSTFRVSSPGLTGRPSNRRTCERARTVPRRKAGGYWVARLKRATTAERFSYAIALALKGWVGSRRSSVLQ
jgi:aminocarboxymuconate-semialdehyde decarboxylase